MSSFLSLLFRVIKRNRLFSVLNIAGLSVGMASFVIIVLWISDELSYDRYNENADRIVRVVSHFKLKEREGHTPYNPAPLAAALRSDFPEVENSVRLSYMANYLVEYDNIVYDEKRVVFADSTFFRVFTVPLVSGSPGTVLSAPRSIVISSSMAEKYFGAADPVGKMLRLDNNIDMQVTGVFEDMPLNSHFHFDFIGAIHTYPDSESQMWLSNNYMTYALLHEGVSVADFESKLSLLVEKYVSEQAAMALGMSWKEIVESGTNLSYTIQPVTDIHLRSNLDGEIEIGGSIAAVRIFGIIALFIIIIACINFTNLSTARATTRLREVGVRKTYGVLRSQLVRQFIAESVVIVILSFILALVLVEVSLPYFNSLTGKSLGISYFSPVLILGAAAMIVAISLMAGAYPAFYLSTFRPIEVLKGDAVQRGSRFSFRSVLVIIQFFISLVLLSSTLILSLQMRYMQRKDLGFEKEGLIVVNNTYLMGERAWSFKEELLRMPGVSSVTVSGYLPIPSNRNNSSVFPDGVISDNLFNCQNWTVDADFVKTYGIEVLSGRDFSPDRPADSMCVLLNLKAVEGLGWDEPLGRIIGVPSDYEGVLEMTLESFTVIGVVEDFHFESLHLEVEPLIIFLGRSRSRTTVRFDSNIDITALVEGLEGKWQEYMPGQPFSFTFVDQRLQQMYKSDRQLGKILSLFTILAFFVSCLGLVGLSVFTSEQRRKEIGLRKVNGSGVGQIIWMLSTDFTKLVALSFAASVPVTVIFMEKWLSGFAYRISISWWVFAATFLVTYLVAMTAIIFQSYSAATANPVDTFRTE